MALSGDTLPQVSDGGWVAGTLHIVTSDGAGPYKAMIDTTGTGSFADAKAMDIVTQVPGTKGNIKKTTTKRWERILRSLGIEKRATNINEDYVSFQYFQVSKKLKLIDSKAIQGCYPRRYFVHWNRCWTDQCLHGEARQPLRCRSKLNLFLRSSSFKLLQPNRNYSNPV